MENKEKLDKIISAQLDEISKMKPGSEQIGPAIQDVSVLLSHSEKMAESETKSRELDLKKSQQETDTLIKSKELEIKVIQAKTDEALRKKELEIKSEENIVRLKSEKRKAWTEFVSNGLRCAVTAGGVVLAVYAERQGWFVGKMGLSMTPKLKL